MIHSFRFDKALLARLSHLCSFAAGATALSEGGGGGGGAPTGGAGIGGGTGSGGVPGVPSAQPGAQGGSPSSGTSGTPTLNWADAPANFREAHEALKRQYEPWGKLAEDLKIDHTVIGTQVRNFQTLVNEAYDIAEEMGYTEEQTRTALQKNLVGTLHWLRQRKAAGAGGEGGGQGGRGGQPGQGGQGGHPNLEQMVQKMIEKGLQPYQEDLTTRQSTQANQLFDNTCMGLMKTRFGESYSTMPDPVKNVILDAASELFKYDEGAAADIFRGKTAGVQKYFEQACTILETAFISWQQWQNKSAGGQGGQGGGQDAGGGQGGGGQRGQGGQGVQPEPYKGDFLADIAAGDDKAFAELRRRQVAAQTRRT